MALTPDDEEMVTLALTELSEVTANNRILEAEYRQLKEFLDEALKELAETRDQLASAEAALATSETIRKQQEAKLAFVKRERGVRRTSWAVSRLRSELNQTLPVLAQAEQSLNDLAILSSTALGLHPSAPATQVPALTSIQQAIEAIGKTLDDTSR